jgi:hypothetical protein
MQKDMNRGHLLANALGVTAHYTGRNGAPDHLTIKWLNMDTGEMPLEPITIWNTPSGLQP